MECLRHVTRIAEIIRAVPLWLFVVMWAMMPLSARAEGLWNHPDTRFADVEKAVAEDDFARVQELLSALRAEYRKSSDTLFVAELGERSKEFTRIGRDYEKTSKARKALESDPADAKSALEVGKYHCVVKGAWSKGLPLLVTGADEQLAAAAKEDLANPAQTEEQLEVGNQWLACSQKAKDAGERSAYQLRARHWFVLAGLSATDKLVLNTAKSRLKQIPLFPDRILIWNTHNSVEQGRGAEAVAVSLLNEGKVVWRQAANIAWKPNDPSYIILRPARVRADQIRVDITKHHGLSGGLGEIQVFAGNVNIADHMQPAVDCYFDTNSLFAPAKLVDGDVSGHTGFWIAETAKSGSATIHFQNLMTTK